MIELYLYLMGVLVVFSGYEDVRHLSKYSHWRFALVVLTWPISVPIGLGMALWRGK